MSVHIDMLETHVEQEPPQSTGPGERTPPGVAALSPQQVIALVEQRAERNRRMRAH